VGIFFFVNRIFNSSFVMFVLAAQAFAGAGKVEINQRHMATAPYVIDQPGQYILTSALYLNATNVHAILVEASHVDIDLNGFTINGPGTGLGLTAIVQDSMFNNLRVRNGNFYGWGGVGAYAINAQGLGNVLEDLTVHASAQGFFAGARSVVQRCIVYSNSFVTSDIHGIYVGAGSTVRDCVVQGLGTISGNAYGIRGTFNVLIEDCVVSGINSANFAYGIYAERGGQALRSTARNIAASGLAYGIFVGDESRISACVGTAVTSPTYASALRSGNRSAMTHGVAADSFVGIETYADSMILSSLSVTNASWGFVAGSRSRISDSFAVANNSTGFYLDGTRGEVTDNDATANVLGFDLQGPSSFAARNAALLSTSSVNYNTIGGTRLGLVISNPGAAFTVTNSWANFSITD